MLLPIFLVCRSAKTNILNYADDIAIVYQNAMMLQRAISASSYVAWSIGMKINAYQDKKFPFWHS